MAICKNYRCRKKFKALSNQQIYCSKDCMIQMGTFFQAERTKKYQPLSLFCTNKECNFYNSHLNNHCLALDIVDDIDNCKFYKPEEF